MANDEATKEDPIEVKPNQGTSQSETKKGTEILIMKARKWGQKLRKQFRSGSDNSHEALEIIAKGPDPETDVQVTRFQREQTQYFNEVLSPAVSKEDFKMKLVAVLTPEICNKYSIDTDNLSEISFETINQALNESVVEYAQNQMDIGLPDAEAYGDNQYWERMRSTTACWRCLILVKPDANRDYPSEYSHMLGSPSFLEQDFITSGDLPLLPEPEPGETPSADRHILIARRIDNNGNEEIQILSRSSFPMVSLGFKSDDRYDIEKITTDIQKTIDMMAQTDPRFIGFQPLVTQLTLSQMGHLSEYAAGIDLDHWTVKPADNYLLNKK